MKTKFALALTALLATSSAFADGFRCETVEGDLKLAIYNSTNPSKGTRTASTMVLSDPSVSNGRRTIAKFTEVKGTLSRSGATFVADVDLRVAESRTAGEYLVGTRLGQVDQIHVDVDFNYGQPVEAGTELDGVLTVVKRNGSEIVRDLICTRYLKN